jgi:hypothetical protein
MSHSGRNERARGHIRIISHPNIPSIDSNVSTYAHCHSMTIVDSIMLNQSCGSRLRPRGHIFDPVHVDILFQILDILLFGEPRVSNKWLRSESDLEVHWYVISILKAFESSMFSANIRVAWMHDGLINKELDWICNYEMKWRKGKERRIYLWLDFVEVSQQKMNEAVIFPLGFHWRKHDISSRWIDRRESLNRQQLFYLILGNLTFVELLFHLWIKSNLLFGFRDQKAVNDWVECCSPSMRSGKCLTSLVFHYFWTGQPLLPTNE